MKNSFVREQLSRSSDFWFAVYAILAAFCAYSCAFAFRKALPAAQFQGLLFFSMDYKTALVIFQILGYMSAKFVGIKFISEMSGKNRAWAIVLMILISEIAWFLFAITPVPYNAFFLILNGFPLGMVWGLTFSFLEGRKLTDVLSAGLCASFIASSGIAKSIGKMVMTDWHVSEFWMPFTVGALYFVPMLLFVWMLNQLPPPNEEDIELRTKRAPMNAKERMLFFRRFAPGLILLTLAYMLLTAYRDFRDNFMADIWQELDYGTDTWIFSQTEVPVSIIVFILIGALLLIKKNHFAFMIIHIVMGLGLLIVGLATYAFQVHLISAPVWMTLIGFGTYLAYVPFNSVLFDRMIATFRHIGTAGFMIYVADSFGYVASISVMFYKNFGHPNLSWLSFFIGISYVLAFGGFALIGGAMVYFYKK